MPSFTRFSKDVEWMTGRKLNLYWHITWRFISPLLLLTVFMAFVTLQMQKPPSYTAWNPKYVCSQIFSELPIKARITNFLPLPDPLRSLLSTAYPWNAVWSDVVLRMRRLWCAKRLHTVKCVSSQGVPHVPCSIFLTDVCNAQKCWSETCHRHSIPTGGSEAEQMPEQSFRPVSLGPWCTFDRQTGREEGSGLRTMLVNSATKACPCWEHLIWMSLSHINCSFFDPSQIHPV